jgi:argininosuccinate synthase
VLRSGDWFTPDRQALDAEADAVQQKVSGVVRLTLFQSNCAVGDVQVARTAKTIALAKKN